MTNLYNRGVSLCCCHFFLALENEITSSQREREKGEVTADLEQVKGVTYNLAEGTKSRGERKRQERDRAICETKEERALSLTETASIV